MSTYLENIAKASKDLHSSFVKPLQPIKKPMKSCKVKRFVKLAVYEFMAKGDYDSAKRIKKLFKSW